MPRRTADKTEVSTPFNFEALTAAEKEAVYQSVDREFTRGELKPLTRTEAARWKRTQAKLKASAAAAARTGPARRKVSPRTKSLSVHVDPGLLAKADRYAKANKLTRAAMVAAGLQMVMRAGSPSPAGEAT